VQHVDLFVTYGDGDTDCIPLSYGTQRTDVAAAFPDSPQAANSGFLLIARLRDGVALVGGCLRGTFADGSYEELAVPNFPTAYVRSANIAEHWVIRIKKGLSELREGKITGSLGFIKREIDKFNTRVRNVQTALGVKAARRWHIVFDHSLGGGANRYREKFVRGLLADNETVVVVTPRLVTLSYELEQWGKFGFNSHSYHSEADVLSELSTRDIACITINNLVSFDDPEAIVSWVLANKAGGVNVRVMLHDYYFVCPSFTLLDETRRYCGVPALDRCKSCLPKNDTLFLSFVRHRDQSRWRDVWWGLLKVADEVIAFSDSTLKIARRAYPALDQCDVRVVPHTVDYLEDHALSPDFGGPLVIGVVGHISYQKGAAIIREMVEIIERESLDVKIVIVGSIEGVATSPVLKQTGVYNPRDLFKILEAERVTIGFLPSIIPETFSFVTSELIHMRLPLAVFDIGAPAERVVNYDFGRVISNIDARYALFEIMDLQFTLGKKNAYLPRIDLRVEAGS
jgi:glycosyltransferase involved in cell wall biosynthesis